jgi:3'(2'), 5'-bisphosphate nucleotidase
VVHIPVLGTTYYAARGQGAYRQKDEEAPERIKRTSRGSALKFCLVAEGSADIYPRLGPTWEWDTGAGHAVVDEAGGRVLDLGGNPLVYNKETLKHGGFVAVGNIEPSRLFEK